MASTVACSDVEIDILRFERECTNLAEIPQEEFNAWIDNWQPSDLDWADQLDNIMNFDNSSLPTAIDADAPTTVTPVEKPAATFSPVRSTPSAATFSSNSSYDSPAIEPEFVETAKGNFTVGKFFLNNGDGASNQSSKDLAPAFQGFQRRRSISKIPLNELYEVMGLAHDPNCALQREEIIMSILEAEGFELGEQTWIRDTDPVSRQVLLESVFQKTVEQFGYSRTLLEAIIRRGTYSRMQCKLRRQRRRRERNSHRAH